MKNLRQEKPGDSVNVSDCDSIEDRIIELMDLRQSLLADETVRNHVSVCDRCARLVADLGALDESLSQVAPETDNETNKTNKTNPRLRGQPAEPYGGLAIHPVSFIASVACLLLVMLTSGAWLADPAVSKSESSSASSRFAANPGFAANPLVPTPAVVQLHVSQPDATSVVSQARFMSAAGFEQISGGVEPFQGYLGMTADLPGIWPLSNSVNATLHLIRSIAEEPPAKESHEPVVSPDLGWHGDAGLTVLV